MVMGIRCDLCALKCPPPNALGIVMGVRCDLFALKCPHHLMSKCSRHDPGCWAWSWVSGMTFMHLNFHHLVHWIWSWTSSVTFLYWNDILQLNAPLMSKGPSHDHDHAHKLITVARTNPQGLGKNAPTWKQLMDGLNCYAFKLWGGGERMDWMSSLALALDPSVSQRVVSKLIQTNPYVSWAGNEHMEWFTPNPFHPKHALHRMCPFLSEQGGQLTTGAKLKYVCVWRG